jgi:hypothetical protein
MLSSNWAGGWIVSKLKNIKAGKKMVLKIYLSEPFFVW